jgi:hypothetical protein
MLGGLNIGKSPQASGYGTMPIYYSLRPRTSTLYSRTRRTPAFRPSLTDSIYEDVELLRDQVDSDSRLRNSEIARKGDYDKRASYITLHKDYYQNFHKSTSQSGNYLEMYRPVDFPWTRGNAEQDIDTYAYTDYSGKTHGPHIDPNIKAALMALPQLMNDLPVLDRRYSRKGTSGETQQGQTPTIWHRSSRLMGYLIREAFYVDGDDDEFERALPWQWREKYHHHKACRIQNFDPYLSIMERFCRIMSGPGGWADRSQCRSWEECYNSVVDEKIESDEGGYVTHEFIKASNKETLTAKHAIALQAEANQFDNAWKDKAQLISDIEYFLRRKKPNNGYIRLFPEVRKAPETAL